jgi:peptidyl-prolyl cis-trans isomerase A (cyclophilin A)
MKQKIFFIFIGILLITVNLYSSEDIELVLMHTSHGAMLLELDRSIAPNTVDNFVGLAMGTKPFRPPGSTNWITGHFYDNKIFHRVIPNFMIQGGCPSGNGSGGPGYQIDCETSPTDNVLYGHIAMANSGPNTNGSQFFIVTRSPGTPHLNGRHTIFGRVVEGMVVAHVIEAVPTGANDRPLEPVAMYTVRIVEEVPDYDISHQDRFEFGIVNVGGASAEHSLTIANTGDVLLQIGPITMRGDNTEDFLCFSLNEVMEIYPGESETISVIFFPNSTGEKNASLVVPNNKPGLNIEIQMTGGNAIIDSDIVSESLPMKLIGNFPNPFNPMTTIEFLMQDSSDTVQIDVYNIRGQKVRSLKNYSLGTGRHSVVWNGRDDTDNDVASGLYFYQVKTGGFTATGKMILMK